MAATPTTPSRCFLCQRKNVATRQGAAFFRNPKTGQMVCEDHLPDVTGLVPASPSRREAIRTENLTKRYDDRVAVDHLSFSIPQGGVIGFVGPNGAGKTTTIRMLMGLVKPTSGSATVLGESITQPGKYLSRVGALIESPAFYANLSGRRNLRALARLGGHDAHNVDDLLAQVGLAERAHHAYKTYSLGMKQRLGIAASLLPDPDLLILDEPTNGLDPAGIHEVRAFLRGLGDKGKTVFVSSHLLSEIQRMCDRLVVLRLGKLVFDGTVQELEQSTRGVIAVAKKPQDHERLRQLAVQAGYMAHVREGSLYVAAPPDWSSELNELARKAGIVLRELRPQAFDLEETILEMTGRESKA